MARRRFSKEYKQEAVSLVQQSDIPVAEIARNLGLNDNVLRRWVKEHADPSKRSFPGQGNPRDEEVTRLKRELLQVKCRVLRFSFKSEDLYKNFSPISAVHCLSISLRQRKLAKVFQ